MKTADEQIAEFHARDAAGGAIDASYPAPVDTPRLIVLDDVLPNPESYRRVALLQQFESVTIGAATFHGIGKQADQQLPDYIHTLYQNTRPTLTFFRRSPESQVEPNFIHTDRDMGDWSGILYLTPHSPKGDGTTFWANRDTGSPTSRAATHEELMTEWASWRDIWQWEAWGTIEAKFNRLILFSSSMFHSRALFDNYGTGDNARLTQLVFGRGDLS